MDLFVIVFCDSNKWICLLLFFVIQNKWICLLLFFVIQTSMDTEMCCPKGKCGCQYFILLTLKKKKFMDTGVLDFINKKNNPGLLFLLKVRSCVFISNFHHSPPPPPKGYKIVSLIIN